MAKYDCTKTKDFMHELKRAAKCCKKKSLFECKECEMGCKNGTCFVSLARDLDCIPERQFDFVIGKIQKWSDDHPEKRELTEDETNILKAFKALGFKYIVADCDGRVCSYDICPVKKEKAWDVDYGVCKDICDTSGHFKDVLSWEDEKPAEIEKLLEGDK